MDYLPLLILPLALTVCLMLFFLRKIADTKYANHKPHKSLKKERTSESFFFVTFIAITFCMLSLAPWLSFYVHSGAKLSLINYFIMQIFIISLLVIAITSYLKKRDYK